MEFSISATSRSPRGKEENGKEYYFYSALEFRKLIADEAFIEYEEVYEDSFYGTLKSEMDRIWSKGHTIVFDVDVKGGMNLKKIFGEDALAVFVQPPSIEELRRRLVGRGTENTEEVEKRIARATEELSFAKGFDYILVNDSLEVALKEAEDLVESLSKSV